MDTKQRLEYLRGELRAERISMGELAELQSLAGHIDAGDVELLEAAGVPEFSGEAMDEFTRAYVECALWSSTDESDESGGVPMDRNYGVEDFAPEALAKMEEDCRRFQAEHGAKLAEAYQRYAITDGSSPEAYAGHDFWLTRNGHGAGFWDRGLGKVGERLTEASKVYGECYLYVGDDGKIYVG